MSFNPFLLNRPGQPDPDEPIPVSQLPNWISTPSRTVPKDKKSRKLRRTLCERRRHKPRHRSAVYRWIKKGIAGVRLSAWRQPDGYYTTLRNYSEFVDRLTSASKLQPPNRDGVRVSSEKPLRSVEKAVARIHQTIRRAATAATPEILEPQ